MKIIRSLLVALAAFSIAATASAQNGGTVTNHAFSIGKGAGTSGYTSLLCPSGQFPMGQTSADPLCVALSGDATATAAGVVAIGANKVTNAQIRQSGALSLIGRSANSTGNVADISAVAASSCVFQETASTLACASLGTNSIAANAVTNAKLATMAAYTLKGNNSGSTATPGDIDVTALTLKASPVTGDIVLIQDSAASNAFKRTTVGALATAGSVASFNGKTGAIGLSVVKQVFIASGTYTPTSGMVYALIECVGSGGAGGGTTGAASSVFAGGGGGAGSYSRSYVSAATVGVSQTVTINNAGTGSAGAAGSAGGDVSVGTLCVGKGGGAGGQSTTGTFGTSGAGGIAGTGDLTIPGGAGAAGQLASGFATMFFTGGQGGNSHFGAGGAMSVAVSAANSNGTGGTNYGAGGSGGVSHNTTGTSTGGAGSKGVVIITEFVIS